MPQGANRASHWDLLLELPSDAKLRANLEHGLLTFEITAPPSSWGTPILVRRLPNHRLIYLDFEGEISGDRGEVARIVHGSIRWEIIEPGSLKMLLEPQSSFSQELKGIMTLNPITRDQWEMRFHRQI